MKQTFDYDNNVMTFRAGAIGSWLGVALYSAFYATGWEVRFIAVWPREVLLLMIVAMCVSGVYFPIIRMRRKTHPHRIVVDDTGIEVPNSRMSTTHIRIPFDRIESVSMGELGLGFHVLDISFEGRKFRIAENVFAARDDFRAVVAALGGKPKR